MTEAFEAVGSRKRVRLLPLEFRKYCCARYQELRGRGLDHGEAVFLIKMGPEYGALPIWAMMLASLLFQLLLAWWKNRNAD